MYDEDMPAFDPEPLDEDPEVNPDEGDGPDYDLAYDLWKEDQLRPPVRPAATKSEYEIGIVTRRGEITDAVVVLALSTDDAFAAARLQLRPAATLTLIDTRPL